MLVGNFDYGTLDRLTTDIRPSYDERRGTAEELRCESLETKCDGIRWESVNIPYMVCRPSVRQSISWSSDLVWAQDSANVRLPSLAS